MTTTTTTTTDDTPVTTVSPTLNHQPPTTYESLNTPLSPPLIPSPSTAEGDEYDELLVHSFQKNRNRNNNKPKTKKLERMDSLDFTFSIQPIKKAVIIIKTSHRSSLYGLNSVYGTFSSKVTADEKERVLHNKKRGIFLPWSKNYKTWWYLTVGASIFTVFFETHYIAFRPADYTPFGSAVIEACLVSVFVVDILINFNLAYYDEDKGTVVYDRLSIAKNYLRFFFWIDLISVFPFYLVALYCTGQLGKDTHLALYLAIFRLSRLFRLYRITHLFRILQLKSRVSFMWLTVIRNLMVVVVWTHLSGCIMYFIARQYSFSIRTFLGSKADVNALSIFERYIASVYWAVVTFGTVGFGDYSATNVHEQIWCMIFIMLSILIMAWMIGSITLLIVKGDQKTGLYRDALNVLHQYCRKNHFDGPFQKVLRTQLQLQFDHQDIADDQVLGHFPSSVRAKLLRKLYLRPLIQTNLMKQVRQQFVDAFLAACSVEVFSPDEEILHRGSISSDLYLLVGGAVTVLPWDSAKPDGGEEADNSNGLSAIELEAGEFINEIGFFTESPQLNTVRTLTVCKTLTLSRSMYKTLADDHPGSINTILNNLLEKVQDMASDFATPSNVKLTKRMEVLNAGSIFDDNNDDFSHHDNGRRSHAAGHTHTSLTAVQDLVQMHMNKLKDDYTTRFLFAASRDDATTIALMCEHGFDPNTSDYDSRTALMVASMKGNTSAVKKLLECYANPNLVDMHGSSALLEAARCGHVETADELLKSGANLCLSESQSASKLCQAVFDGDVVLLRRLLQAGVDVNAWDYDKRTAAHIAAAEGNVAAMKVLVGFGADLSLEDRWHNTVDDEARNAKSGPLLDYLQTLQR